MATETATSLPPGALILSPRRPAGRIRRFGGAVVRTVRRAGGRAGGAARRSYRNLRVRGSALAARARGGRGRAVAAYRARGGGFMRIGKVVFLWVLGGATYAVMDLLLTRAGVESQIARTIMGGGIGVALIVMGGPALASIGVGVALSSALHLLYDEVTPTTA